MHKIETLKAKKQLDRYKLTGQTDDKGHIGFQVLCSFMLHTSQKVISPSWVFK